ncbi:MAG: pseudouridine synthase, partial [Candidatus Woesearchaeota archaeon]
IEKGLLIEGKKTSKATIDPVDNCVYDITIHEGRNRIVRKMFKELDCRILGLQRIKIGKLALRDLRPGQWKHMTSQEIKKVFR